MMTAQNLLPLVQDSRTSSAGSFEFALPSELEAHEPPEARGVERDQVRLMVSFRARHGVIHARFDDLPAYLDPGDLLVINTSGTMNASLPAHLPDGSELELHLSTHLPGDLWTVELRTLTGEGSEPFSGDVAGLELSLPANGTAAIHTRYLSSCGCESPRETRLWVASLRLPIPLLHYLDRHGSPIRYGYVPRRWPGSYYQTVFATDRGSAEMPSAGRPFSADLLSRLIARGVQVVPLVLHTGVSSLERHEPPLEEFYRVPAESARAVNSTRKAGKRVVAVGTTVVRALESATDGQGIVHPAEGWTCLVVTPEHALRAVDGLLTGLHEPRSSHLALLQAFTGREMLKAAYEEAVRESYLWHEFGDLHLLLP